MTDLTPEKRAELRAELLKDKPLGFSKGVVRSLLDALEAKDAQIAELVTAFHNEDRSHD